MNVVPVDLDRIRDALALPHRPIHRLPPGWRRAAVLLPIHPGTDGWHLLLTRRTDAVPTHKGQISFPGGRVEPTDPDLAATALRETHEELGIPPDHVQLMGRLDDVQTRVSQYVVSPFVGLLPAAPLLRPNPAEIAAVFSVPLLDLLDPAIHHVEWWEYAGRPVPLHFYTWRGITIWGLTGAILADFLHRLQHQVSP
ncbi:MAG: CoA pyrophosphatase [Ardenticatenia bacterium]|nr:CoA pyrophosphatase [Ardenticatenia bacterium]